MAELDMLRDLWNRQEELNQRIGVNTADMTEKEQIHWVLNYCRAMNQEIAELTDSVPWKWWAKYQDFDQQNARVEIVDLFHFLISLAQVMGMSAEDIHGLYVQKSKVNHDRQDSGYSEKDESDNKNLTV